MPITEHTIKTERHTTFSLAAGPENGPLVRADLADQLKG